MVMTASASASASASCTTDDRVPGSHESLLLSWSEMRHKRALSLLPLSSGRALAPQKLCRSNLALEVGSRSSTQRIDRCRYVQR
jgi:hypothetical protein